MSPRPAVEAAVVASFALSLAGCSGRQAPSVDATPSPAAATTSAPATPAAPTTPPAPTKAVRRPQPPRELACYRMTLRQATRPTNQQKPVRCTSVHTAQTIHVGRLHLVVGGHRLAVDSDRVQHQLARTCPAELRRYLGGTTQARRLSRLSVVWFSPTLTQAASGARWFRCDAVALADDKRLLPLPIGIKDLLDRPGALATFGTCGTAAPGSRGFRRVACGVRHSWVARSTIDIPGTRYPGVAAVRTSGNQACADQVRAANGSPLRFTYGWEWPTKEQWAAGQHYGYCWAPNHLA